MQQPTVGRIVLGLVDPDTNNGADIAPAIITRVWSESASGRWTVNLRELRDQPPSAAEWRTSVYLHADEETARTEAAGNLASKHYFWPPRI